MKAWPIVVGLLVDTVGSILVGVLYAALIVVTKGPDAAAATPNTMGALIAAEVVGLALVALGGFVAGRLVETQQARHGAAVGLGALFIGLIAEFAGLSEDLPRWYGIVSFVLIVPSGVVGGHLAGKRRP